MLFTKMKREFPALWFEIKPMDTGLLSHPTTVMTLYNFWEATLSPVQEGEKQTGEFV